MKSRTLSCNMVTAFKKNLTRFAPLWAVYLIGGFLVMMTMTESDSPGGIANTLSLTIGPFSIINMIYAGLAAQLLFGDLYNSRLCNALHAMPMRREQWFLSHIAAGLCFSLVPHLIVMPIVMLAMQQFGFVALIWMLGMLLEYLFFFGLAVFSALCVGNRFAMVVVYGILNFGSMIAFWFCNAVYVPNMYGVILTGSEGFVQFCPVVQMSSFNEMVLMDSYHTDSVGYYNSRQWTYEGLGEGWGYLVICAVIGLALLVAALLLYRRRRLESAGDFIAVKPLAPIFSVVATLCVSAVCAMFGQLFSNDFMLVFFIAGLVVGYFGTQMLLQRTAKVFRPKAFGKLGLIAAAMILSLLLVQWDAFGIVRWTPKADRVESVTLSYNRLELTEPEDIQLVINLHKEAIAQGDVYDPSVGYYNYVRMAYKMKNGGTVERGYEIPGNSKAYQALKSVYGRASIVLGDVSDMDAYVRSVELVEFKSTKLIPDPEKVRGLVEAIKADCEEGNMAQNDAYHNYSEVRHYVYLNQVDEDNMYSFRQIKVYGDAKNTLKWLEENIDEWVELSGGPEDWDSEWNEKFGY